MSKGRYVIVVGEGEDVEVFGVFTGGRADDLAERYNNAAVGIHFAEVVEVYPASQILEQIREEEAHYE